MSTKNESKLSPWRKPLNGKQADRGWAISGRIKHDENEVLFTQDSSRNNRKSQHLKKRAENSQNVM